MSFQSFAGPLAFTLFIGAARADATPAQRQALQERLMPLLPRYRSEGDEGPIRAAVRDVMGVDWKPTGQWREWISKLDVS